MTSSHAARELSKARSQSPALKRKSSEVEKEKSSPSWGTNLGLIALAYGVAVIYVFGHSAMTTFAWYYYICAISSLCLAVSLMNLYSSADWSLNDVTVVCFAYWHRSVFMHCTVERDCLFDWALCSPLWGRTVACAGELAMMHLVLHAVIPERQATNLVAAIAAAECISFVGVITRQYWWFIVENGTWTVVALWVAVSIAKEWASGKLEQQQQQDATVLLKKLSCGAFAALFVYNTFIDLPMYYARSNEFDSLEGRRFSLAEGVSHAASCLNVTADEETWQPQMVWMTLNYTLAPAACLYVAATTAPVSKKEKGA